jgi:hypothetical protein
MHNIVVQLCIFLLALIIAGVKSIDLDPAQLLKQAQKGTNDNSQSTNRQASALLHLQQVLKSNLLIINLFLLTLLATANYGVFQIVGFAFIWLVVVHLLAAAKGVEKRAQQFTHRHLPSLLRLAAALEPALKLLDDSRFLNIKRERIFYTRGELLEAIQKSKGVLTTSEKQQFEAVLSEPITSKHSQDPAEIGESL